MGRTLYLMYHALTTGGEEIPAQDKVYAVDFGEWQRQLDMIAASDLLSPVKDASGGECGENKTRIGLTFDDCWQSHSRLALPELEKRGWTASVFICTGQIGAAGMMSWEDVRQLADAGWTIGSHGTTHRFLRGLSDDELAWELAGSKAEIEKALGIEISELSLPGGRGDARVTAAAKKAGYERVYTSVPGVQETGCEVPRCALGTANHGGEILEKLLADPEAQTKRLAARKKRLEYLKKLFGDGAYHWLHGKLSTVTHKLVNKKFLPL